MTSLLPYSVHGKQKKRAFPLCLLYLCPLILLCNLFVTCRFDSDFSWQGNFCIMNLWRVLYVKMVLERKKVGAFQSKMQKDTIRRGQVPLQFNVPFVKQHRGPCGLCLKPFQMQLWGTIAQCSFLEPDLLIRCIFDLCNPHPWAGVRQHMALPTLAWLRVTDRGLQRQRSQETLPHGRSRNLLPRPRNRAGVSSSTPGGMSNCR